MSLEIRGRTTLRMNLLHERAMEFAGDAFLEKARGNEGKAKELYAKALGHEKNAAHLTEKMKQLEPTRSVLHRSAASMAMNCGEYREAERLIKTALDGNPPQEIRRELDDLMGVINGLQKHPPPVPRKAQTKERRKTMNLEIHLGSFEKPIIEQLPEGLAFSEDDTVRIQEATDAINKLHLLYLLTDGEADKARQRLMKMIGRALIRGE